MKGAWGKSPKGCMVKGSGFAAKGAGKPAPKWAPAPPSFSPPAHVTNRYRGGPSAAPPAESSLQVMWLSVDPTDSRLLSEEGLVECDAPALFHDKQQTIFSSASWIYGDVCNADNVVFHHDPDWQEYPEVAAALKENGAEDDCYCIAVDKASKRWAVGVASGWKNRETAAKLALSLALVKDDEMLMHKTCASIPEFRSACAAAGFAVPSGGRAKGPAGGKGANGNHAAPAAKPKQQDYGASDDLAPVSWITIASGKLIEEDGLPDEAPAITHVKGQAPFSEAHHVLQELVEDIGEEVVFEHDPDLNIFPEVAEALKEVGIDDACVCIAKCASKGKWGVGLAYGWKGREIAGKLALAVAIAKDDIEMLDKLGGYYPDFVRMLGLDPPEGQAPAPPPAKKPRREFAGDAAPPQEAKAFGKGAAAAKGPAKGAAPTAKGKAAFDKGAGKGKAACGKGPKGADKGAEKAKGKRKPCENPMPRDAPLWLQLPIDEEQPEVLGELPGGAVAVATENMERKALYGMIDKVLTRLLPEDEVQFFEDVNWKQFPQVGEGLKAHSDEEVPMMLAVVPDKAWGVGFGYSTNSRTAAAKVALGGSLMLRQAEEGEIPDLSEFGEFEEFVGEVTVSP